MRKILLPSRGNTMIPLLLSLCNTVFALGIWGEEKGEVLSSPRELPLANPCPEAHDILPCKCSYEGQQHDYIGMTMDCSGVNDQDELRKIFSQDFPQEKFRQLYILFNEDLTVLRAGDLGNASFQNVMIEYGALAEIQDGALKGSENTLTDLTLYGNRLTSLPNISSFSKLEFIGLTGNWFTEFPMLESKSLLTLDLGGNKITEIPKDPLKHLPSLGTLDFYCNPVKEINPGTFLDSGNLTYLDLRENQLTTLPKDAINLQGKASTLDLSGNKIDHVGNDSFHGIIGTLNLIMNQMTELPEADFKPLFENNIVLGLFVDENQLVCGCDLAWLVTDPDLLHHLRGTPSCANGTLVKDLDPQYYKDNCNI